MTSAIDPTKPTAGDALTADVRANFQTAATEISILQDQITTLQDQIASLQTAIGALQTTAGMFTPADPPATGSPWYVCAGLTIAFTPQNNQRAVIVLDGTISNDTVDGVTVVQLVWGAGSPPIAGEQITSTDGTMIGTSIPFSAPTADAFTPVTLTGLMDNMTPQTAYWVDAAIASQSGGGAASIQRVTITIFELVQ